jgi:FKBP-type peptidyl-prolyl cis-trans isomerase 2
MRLGKTVLTVVIVCLLLMSSGCLSDDDEATIKVDLNLMGEDTQNVVQGNNTTFVFAVDNTWKANATFEMSIKGVPDKWGFDFLPKDVFIEAKNKGRGVRLNISIPLDTEERGFSMTVTVKGKDSDVHRRSETITIYVLSALASPELEVVSQGDTVYVNYTGFLLNGSVFDTTIEDIATSFSIEKSKDFQGRANYDPAPFHAGRNELVRGFEKNFAGMRKGETKSFFVPEEEAYSVYEDVTLNITDTVPMTEEWTSTEFARAFRQDPAMWMTVTHRKWGWTATVVAIADDDAQMVTLQLDVAPGDNTTAYGWESIVQSVDSSANGGKGEIVIVHHPTNIAEGKEPKLYNSTAPKEFDFGWILETTETTVTIRVQRSHHALAGQDLIFMVKIHDFQV